eukprot:5997550-Karenia_brevis.AAC.1
MVDDRGYQLQRSNHEQSGRSFGGVSKAEERQHLQRYRDVLARGSTELRNSIQRAASAAQKSAESMPNDAAPKAWDMSLKA